MAGIKPGLSSMMADAPGPDGRAGQADFFLSEDERDELPVARKGPGRPPGAKNRRHDQIRARFLARWNHPLDVLGAIQSMPVGELADLLGCKKGEALHIQVRAAVEALPYIESKQPVKIETDGEGLPVLILGRIEGGQGAARVVGRAMPELAPILDDAELLRLESQAAEFIREIAIEAEACDYDQSHDDEESKQDQ